MLTVQTAGEPITFANWSVWLGLAISLAIALTFYALRSIGIYKLAKKAQLKNSFMAWIPFVWIYTACQLIGNEKFFGKPFYKFSLAFCLVFTAAQVANLSMQFIVNFPIFGNLLAGNEMVFAPLSDLKPEYRRYELSPAWCFGIGAGDVYGAAVLNIEKALRILNPIFLLLDLASIIITINVYVSLFRKYWPQHYMLLSLLSIFFGIFPIFAFVIRNREPISYTDYLKARYNQMYYGAQNNPYGPNMNGQNPNMNGQNPNMNGQNPYNNNGPVNPGDPFSDFADKKDIDPGDPFADFDKKNNEDDK